MSSDTLEQSWTPGRSNTAGDHAQTPGLLVVFSGARAMQLAVPLRDGECVLGRDDVAGVPLGDGRMSRQHARVRFDGSSWEIEDLGSRNGTFVDGIEVSGRFSASDCRILRTGDSLFLFVPDLARYPIATVEQSDGIVIGPTLRRSWNEIERAARAGGTLFLAGETGSGKELAARQFHRSGSRASGPFVAVNCATIPPNIAERLLFGVRKGTYSGADADSDGFVQSAHGGTLFLDEIGELDGKVQATLLRVLDSKEVVALGATKARKVDFTLCSATHRDLRAQVAAGSFREDLYFRIARPIVSLPSLRDRLEDIPWLIQREVRQASTLPLHFSFVEECMRRSWPGNVRELGAAVREATSRADALGAPRIEAEHLHAEAGFALAPATETSASGEADPERVRALLQQHGGNVTATARALGWHRNQLRRWLAKHGESGSDDGS